MISSKEHSDIRNLERELGIKIKEIHR